MVKSKVILVVRDGWGYTEETKRNAVYMANTPNNDRYMSIYPWTLLKCTGNAVVYQREHKEEVNQDTSPWEQAESYGNHSR